ncbi:MAG: AraC family transcriptional regulator [Pseudomonadota bacterium]
MSAQLSLSSSGITLGETVQEPAGHLAPSGATILAFAGRSAPLAPEEACGTGDPVILHLFKAVGETRTAHAAASDLYADALRLAIAARRLLGEREPASARRPPRTGTGLLPWRLKRVMAFIDDRLDTPIGLSDMAAAAGLSRMHFAAQFRISTGLRPHEYLLKRRVERAQQIMRDSREPLAQIALSVGFQTQAHFSTVFRRFAGMPPHRWRSAHS